MKHFMYYIFYVLIFCLCFMRYNVTYSIITFYIRPYPTIALQPSDSDSSRYRTITMESHALDHYITQSPSNVGVLATYGGYLAISDFSGQVMFPRRHENPTVHILVTQKITPIIMLANTVHHWEIQENAPARMYLIERKLDANTQFLYWDVQQMSLPKDKIIPLNTITIFAHPDHIYIPEGATLSNTNPQLILPDIYAKNNIERLNEALYVLNIKRFFGLVRFAYEKDALLFMKLISN